MALATLGTLDVSVVTDRLIELLKASNTAWPQWVANGGPIDQFTFSISGASPDATRAEAGCHLTLSLLHVTPNAFQANSMTNGRALTGTAHPLALDLYYLLSAYSDDNYLQEQRAMSIALRCLHEHPVVQATIVLGGEGTQAEEFIVSMEVQTADEMSRLWQAFAVPARPSAVYRVSVVFVTPPAPALPVHPRPDTIVLVAGPAELPFAAPAALTGTERTVRVFAPGSTVGDVKMLRYDTSPATVAAGESFLLLGSGLAGTAATSVYLQPPAGPELDVTASWVVAGESAAHRLLLRVPAAAAPVAGIYQLRVGADGPHPFRSNATPFSIAARVDAPPNPPLLTASGGIYTIGGAGFVPGATSVLLGTVALTPAASPPPGQGEFTVAPDGASIALHAPDDIAPGRYDVRVRVHDVESSPAGWVDL